jgi:hypothetical protein
LFRGKSKQVLVCSSGKKEWVFYWGLVADTAACTGKTYKWEDSVWGLHR